MIAALDRTLKEASDKKNVKLSYNKITQKKTVHLDPGTVFSMDMSNILGFSNSLVTTARETDSVVDMVVQEVLHPFELFVLRFRLALPHFNHGHAELANILGVFPSVFQQVTMLLFSFSFIALFDF